MDHKDMAAIAADQLAGRQPEDNDVPMENMVVDDPAPTPSSTPSSPVHCTMTIGEDGAEEGVGTGSLTTMFSIGTSSSSSYLPASRSVAMAAISL